MIQSKSAIQQRLTEKKREKIRCWWRKANRSMRFAAVGDPPPAAPGGCGPNFPTVVYNELTKK